MSPDDIGCEDCGTSAPFEPSGETTLTREGWRLSRRVQGGVVVLEWRCPTCARERRRRALEGLPTSPPTPPSDRRGS